MHAQRPESVIGGSNRPNGRVHANVPQLDLAVATAGNELTQATPLQVHACDPLSMVFPYSDHGLAWRKALIVCSYCTVPETGDEDVARHQIRGQRSDARSGTSGDRLDQICEYGRSEQWSI